MIIATRIIILLLTLFSVLVILFRIGVIDPIFGHAERANEINEMMANLSYSYLAGLIFYLFNDGAPRFIRKIRAWLTLRKDINYFATNLYCFLRITALSYGITHELKDIKYSDLAKENIVDDFQFKISIPTKESQIIADNNAVYALKYKGTAQKLLTHLIQNPDFSYLGNNMVNLMAKLHADDYFRGENLELYSMYGTIELYQSLIKTLYVQKPQVKISHPTIEERLKHEADTTI